MSSVEPYLSNPLGVVGTQKIKRVYFSSNFASGELIVKTIKYAKKCDVVAEPGDHLSVHYVGRLDDENGKKFDASRDRGQTFNFQLGAGQVSSLEVLGLKLYRTSLGAVVKLVECPSKASVWGNSTGKKCRIKKSPGHAICDDCKCK